MDKHIIIALFLLASPVLTAQEGAAPATLGVEAVATEQGLTITRTVRHGAAERAGLTRLDVILSVNGTEVKTPEDLRALLATCKAGDTLTLRIRRGNREETRKAKLTELAALTETEPLEFPDEARVELEEFSDTINEIAYILSDRQPDLQHLRKLLTEHAAKDGMRNTYFRFSDAYGSISVEGGRDGVFVHVHRAEKTDHYRIDASASANNPLPDNVRRRFYNFARN